MGTLPIITRAVDREDQGRLKAPSGGRRTCRRCPLTTTTLQGDAGGRGEDADERVAEAPAKGRAGRRQEPEPEEARRGPTEPDEGAPGAGGRAGAGPEGRAAMIAAVYARKSSDDE